MFIEEGKMGKTRKKKKCICVKTCDCQNPEPKFGVALVSNECPIHNMNPDHHPDCGAEKHFAHIPPTF